MGVGTSIVAFAVGAILRFAVTAQTTGFSIHTIGVILMIVGGVGFVVSLLFWGSWGEFHDYGSRSRRAVYRNPDGTVVEESRTSQF